MLENSVIIKGRIRNKHDTEENWNKATNFAPLLGETIVYDPDSKHPYARYKVGIWDGESPKTADMLIMNLPFANQPDVISDDDLSSLFTASYISTRSFDLHLIDTESNVLTVAEIVYKPDFTTWGDLVEAYPGYFTKTTSEWDKATGKPYVKFNPPYHSGDYIYKKAEVINPEDPVSVPCTTADLIDLSVTRGILICEGTNCPVCQMYSQN
jgi:hypothetical protein